jgi:hypothetical protein
MSHAPYRPITHDRKPARPSGDLPPVTRRQFLASSAALAASVAAPSLAAGRSLSTAVAAVVHDPNKVVEGFFLSRRHRHTVSWLNAVHEFNSGVVNDGGRSLRRYAKALLKHPPTESSLKEFFTHPQLVRSDFGKAVIGNRPPAEWVEEITRLSRLSPVEMAQHVERIIHKPNFADMAAARKAGGYPVPAGYEAAKKISVGEHTASGEWRERALASARIVAEPGRGR